MASAGVQAGNDYDLRGHTHSGWSAGRSSHASSLVSYRRVRPPSSSARATALSSPHHRRVGHEADVHLQRARARGPGDLPTLLPSSSRPATPQLSASLDDMLNHAVQVMSQG